MSILCIVVENRQNKSVLSCFESIKNSNEEFFVISSTDGGNEFDDFSCGYKHMSSNSREFELICFRRYFLIKKMLVDNESIDEFLLLDSDVLVFDGLSKHIESIKGEELFMGSFDENGTVDSQISPHVSYWKRSALFSFVEYLLSTYSNSVRVKELEDIASKFSKERKFGGVSDMTLLYLWAKDHQYMKPINAIYSGGVVDHNIGHSRNGCGETFVSFMNVKKAHFFGNNVFLKRKSDGIFVRCYLLHFQGKAKVLMGVVVRRSALRTVVLSMALRGARLLKKVVNVVS